VLLTKGLKSSLQRELDSFYREVTGGDFNIRHVTKGAFTRARAKLNPEAFVEMNANVVNTFYSEAPYLCWHNMRLLACDGTRLLLPRHSSIIEEFGERSYGPQANSKRTLGTCSFLYDPLNLITLDAQLAPMDCGEQTLLQKHLDKIQEGDLLLLDRGYPSLALMFSLMARQVQFCIRMKVDWWLDVKDFVESGKKEQIVAFHLPKKDQALRQAYPGLPQQITCRLIRIDLDNGEKEILCTSLLDDKKYVHEDFVELYHYRWNIEEAYKLFKARIEVENFSGKTARAVKQDFHAKVFAMTWCAVLAFPIEEKVKKEHEQDQNTQPKKINRTSAYTMASQISIGLFIKRIPRAALEAFDNIVQRTTEIIRPKRKFERKKVEKKPKYHMNYKRM